MNLSAMPDWTNKRDAAAQTWPELKRKPCELLRMMLAKLRVVSNMRLTLEWRHQRQHRQKQEMVTCHQAPE